MLNICFGSHTLIKESVVNEHILDLTHEENANFFQILSTELYLNL